MAWLEKANPFLSLSIRANDLCLPGHPSEQARQGRTMEAASWSIEVDRVDQYALEEEGEVVLAT